MPPRSLPTSPRLYTPRRGSPILSITSLRLQPRHLFLPRPCCPFALPRPSPEQYVCMPRPLHHVGLTCTEPAHRMDEWRDEKFRWYPFTQIHRDDPSLLNNHRKPSFHFLYPAPEKIKPRKLPLVFGGSSARSRAQRRTCASKCRRATPLLVPLKVFFLEAVLASSSASSWRLS